MRRQPDEQCRDAHRDRRRRRHRCGDLQVRCHAHRTESHRIDPHAVQRSLRDLRQAPESYGGRTGRRAASLPFEARPSPAPRTMSSSSRPSTIPSTRSMRIRGRSMACRRCIGAGETTSDDRGCSPGDAGDRHHVHARDRSKCGGSRRDFCRRDDARTPRPTITSGCMRWTSRRDKNWRPARPRSRRRSERRLLRPDNTRSARHCS